jgi:hypothetical protein
MAKNYAIVLELTLQILTDDACLNASHHINLVDPFDLVHPCHVKRDDHALFSGVQNECLRHVGSTAIWYYHDVMLIGKLDDFLNLGMIRWIDDDVCAPLEGSVSQSVDLS